MQKIVEGFRLSPQQEHLWWLHQSEADMATRATCAVKISGPVDASILESAVEKTISRHEILRTTFQRLPGMSAPLQVVSESSPARIQRYDLSEFQPPNQAAKLTEILTASYLPDDFDDPVPLYLSLITTSPDEHTLLINLAALCSDEVGLKNFVFELGRCYAACLSGEETLDEPMQYADFSDWQNEILTSDEAETGRAHWRQDTTVGQADLILPLETASLGTQKFKPESLSYAFAPHTVAQLERVSALQKTSVSTSLLGAFYIVLSRLGGAAQLTLGVSFDGRNYEELAAALGLFARFLPVQAEFAPDLRWPQLVAALDGSLSEAARWQELFTYGGPGSTGLASGAAGREQSAAAFYPFCFEFVEDANPAVSVTEELRFTLQSSVAYISRFKVLLRCLRQSDGSLVAEWHYDGACYTAAEVARLVERWTAALESIGADEGALRVAEVEVVGAGERAELLGHSRGAEEKWDGLNCVHEMFAAQAARTPEAIAVAYEEERVSYGELNRRANQLAGYLMGKGVGAEERVGLMMERSIEMVVGMLGILKAGGAYVPLEPSQPGERLARMAQDAGVRVVVSVAELSSRLTRCARLRRRERNLPRQ